VPSQPSPERDERVIVTFGLVRPGKGLEDVVALARLVHQRGLDWRVQVVGQVPANQREYARTLRAEAAGLPLEWLDGLDHEAAAAALGRAAITYLPFPDGASERRGTLLACLAAGTAVITTDGPQTPLSLRNAVTLAETPADALAAAAALRADDGRAARLREAGTVYAARFSWERIAAEHIALYQSFTP
jgi:glycosyltransferase involved in cell wall biosynthesis